MTTVVYRDGVMMSDGQVSFGDRIDQTNLKKVRKINGCLVGGAGRLSSVLQFFSWFEEWSNAQLVQGDSPHVQVFIPECLDDEDFTGLVVFTDGVIFMYEGGKRCYEIPGEKYYAIGSGADFALSAMDAGATAEEAITVAIKRDVFSGGEIFKEELEEEQQELTRELASEMNKEDLIKYIFGDENPNEENKEDFVDISDKTLTDEMHYTIYKDGFVQLFSEDTNVAVGVISNLEDKQTTMLEMINISKKDLKFIASTLTGVTMSNRANKDSLVKVIYDVLIDIWKENKE